VFILPLGGTTLILPMVAPAGLQDVANGGVRGKTSVFKRRKVPCATLWHILKLPLWRRKLPTRRMQ
jgi:hypothetical protein